MAGKGRNSIWIGNKVYIRVLFSEQDYLELKKIAEEERTDVSSLVRRAVARFYSLPVKRDSPDQPVQ